MNNLKSKVWTDNWMVARFRIIDQVWYVASEKECRSALNGFWDEMISERMGIFLMLQNDLNMRWWII